MIEFREVRLRYPYDEYELFKGLSFTLDEGVNTLLIDTQSGKTSLCRLLVKDITATDGGIYVDGRELGGITNADLDILYLPGKPALFDRKSILYNIEYPLKVRKVPRRERREIALRCAEMTGVDVTAKTKDLDPSLRKRVALARGLTVPRKWVLWDDYFDSDEEIERTMTLFGEASHILVTSDSRQARGNTVLLDGGVSVYQGDAEGAREAAERLEWLTDRLRSE